MGKVKTSLSLSQRVLQAIKRIAKREDRSVSYVLEKYVEAKVEDDKKRRKKTTKILVK